jgi:hypothetical protein
MTTKDLVIQLPEVFIGTKSASDFEISIAEQAGIVIEQPQTPIWQTILLIGVVIASLIFLFKIARLYVLKHNNPKRWQGNVLIVKLIKSTAAFSFFNTIFLGEQIPETEKSVIYKHELVHIKELHTLDLLFFEILKIFFWFNPLVYIYQSRIKELHEYIADAKASKQNGKADYYQSLLNQVFDVNTVSFTNTFFKKSLIKKRIAMLQKSKSKQLHLIKYTLLIPMVFAMLIYTSTEVRAQEKVERENFVVSQELTDEELIQKYYEELMQMKKDGKTFLEIAKYSDLDIKSIDSFLVTKEKYLKSRAYMKFVADGMIARKSENGTLTDQDIETANNMKLGNHKTYLEYKTWRFSEEGIEHWESYARDGSLRFFVKEIGNQTQEEKKRLDGMLKQLENNDFEKIIMTDGSSTFTIDSYESSKSATLETEEVPFSVIDETPTTKECKDLPTNIERKNCMNQFVTKHINKNFNTKIGDSLSPGRKRIFVQFKIDTEGNVKDILARGPSPELEVEAKRVIKTLPQFIPGKQKGELVTVPFSIPIVFQVAGDSNNNVSQVQKSYDALIAQRDRILKSSTKKNPVVIQLNRQIDSLNNILNSTSKTPKYDTFINHLKPDVKENDIIPFFKVDLVPAFIDCELITDNEKRKACTNNGVNKFVNQNFNTELASKLGVTGRQKIFVNFVVNKKGTITNILARASHPALEKEAIRVINQLPQFVPAIHKGEIVEVSYSLPIMFQVAANKKD